MSFTIVATYRCDGCGIASVRDRLSTPQGWVEPAGIGAQAGPHFCPGCVTRMLKLPDALVPVEARRG